MVKHKYFSIGKLPPSILTQTQGVRVLSPAPQLSTAGLPLGCLASPTPEQELADGFLHLALLLPVLYYAHLLPRVAHTIVPEASSLPLLPLWVDPFVRFLHHSGLTVGNLPVILITPLSTQVSYTAEDFTTGIINTVLHFRHSIVKLQPPDPWKLDFPLSFANTKTIRATFLFLLFFSLSSNTPAVHSSSRLQPRWHEGLPGVCPLKEPTHTSRSAVIGAFPGAAATSSTCLFIWQSVPSLMTQGTVVRLAPSSWPPTLFFAPRLLDLFLNMTLIAVLRFWWGFKSLGYSINTVTLHINGDSLPPFFPFPLLFWLGHSVLWSH